MITILAEKLHKETLREERENAEWWGELDFYRPFVS